MWIIALNLFFVCVCVCGFSLSVQLKSRFAFQVKSLARQLYDEYFREAEATPRGVVAKLKSIVKQLDSALAIQIGHLRVSKKNKKAWSIA